MQIAFVSPVSVQRWTQDYTFYYMAFPHVLQHNTDYARFFRHVCGIPANFITLNPYLGCDEDILIRWIRMLRPAELVLPNTENNREVTTEQAKYYIRLCYKYCNDNNLPKNFMGVPQGRSKEDWLDSLRELTAIGSISTIGISKNLSFCDNRLGLSEEVKEIVKNKHIHLLGCSDLQEIKEGAKKYKWVRSIDTKKIAEMSKENIQMRQLSNLSYQSKMEDKDFFKWTYNKVGVISFRENMHYVKGLLGHYDLSRV